MMHYDDEALCAYADGSSPTSASIEAHVAACARCAATLQDIRQLMDLLRTDAFWESAPALDVDRFEERLQAERAEAALLCDHILQGPVEWWPQRLRTAHGARTTALVQELLERAERSPRGAEIMASMALSLVEQLHDAGYPELHLKLVTVQALRGYVSARGGDPEAMQALARAERMLHGLPGGEFERAHLKLVKASLFGDDAVTLAREAAETFLRFGDRPRAIQAPTLLIARAASLHEREPLEALRFAEAAISVTEALPGEHELRGTAWKERANALSYLGRFEEALESCRRAERAYRELPAPELGLATVAFVRASILFEQQQYDAAEEPAAVAERGFRRLGDAERQTCALHLRGLIAYERGDLEQATSLFERVSAYGHAAADPLWTARAAQALANCQIDRHQLAEATLQLHGALERFRALELRMEVNRTEWALARVLLAGGKFEEAIPRLQAVADTFEHAGMATDAALAGLDQADALVALGRTREVTRLAAHLFEVFRTAGMLTGALSAMAYVKESAERGVLLPTDVHVVRRFLRRAERQPELLFLRPAGD
jgi:tetratricopeptide (TPR) repeat protein